MDRQRTNDRCCHDCSTWKWTPLQSIGGEKKRLQKQQWTRGITNHQSRWSSKNRLTPPRKPKTARQALHVLRYYFFEKAWSGTFQSKKGQSIGPDLFKMLKKAPCSSSLLPWHRAYLYTLWHAQLQSGKPSSGTESSRPLQCYQCQSYVQ